MREKTKETLQTIAALTIGTLLVGSCVYGFNYSDVAKQAKADVEAQRLADAKPRRIQRADNGCEVFAFKPQDRWLYFTKCPNSSTSTTTEWEVSKSVGKRVERSVESTTINQQ